MIGVYLEASQGLGLPWITVVFVVTAVPVRRQPKYCHRSADRYLYQSKIAMQFRIFGGLLAERPNNVIFVSLNAKVGIPSTWRTSCIMGTAV